MSTKIYDGYVINKTLTTYQLRLLIKRIQESTAKLTKKFCYTHWTKAAITYLDDVATGYRRPKEPRSPSFQVFNDSIEAQKELKKGYRQVDWDYSIILFIYPLKNKTLLIINTEHNELRKKLLTTCPEIRFYGYWDNTDPDKDCSKKEWRQREKDWNKAFDDHLNPACLKVTLDSYKYMRPSPEEILKLAPKFKDRVRWQARNLLVNKRMKYLRKKEGIPARELNIGNKHEHMDKMIHIANESLWWLSDGLREKKPEVLKLFEKEKQRVAKILKEHLTVEDLTNDVCCTHSRSLNL